jgi:hypothetical protein
MSQNVGFDGRVAIVTGGGRGLGRQYEPGSTRGGQRCRCRDGRRGWIARSGQRIFKVELRGLEPLTPTLPAAGRVRDQARWCRFGVVAVVVEGATVVAVVVKNVVSRNLISHRRVRAQDQAQRRGVRVRSIAGDSRTAYSWRTYWLTFRCT